jgi:cytochrome c-type biogenesis protein CcmH/NrfF
MISNIVRAFVWLLPVIFLVVVVVLMVRRRTPHWIEPPTPTGVEAARANEKDNHEA